MAIAALPLPLLAYLIALWPILPGSLEILTNKLGAKSRAGLITCITTGVVFLVFNLWLILGPLVGYGWN